MDDDEDRRRSPSDRGDGYGDDGKNDRSDAVIGSTSLRPVFLGNLTHGFQAEEVIAIFERPMEPPNASFRYSSIPVDRIDLKRGYCFVFLKDVSSQSEKEQTERFVQEINGMKIPNVTAALRAEFARGDGRVKRKEDERRKNIEPSDTLFVVNFHEQTTRRADLEMLFQPFGEITRIDLKRNYAFVQFRTIPQATRAKEATNGGKLDQSVLTVEYVARQRPPGEPYDPRDRRPAYGGPSNYRRDDRGRFGDDRRGPPPPSSHRGGPPPPSNYDRRYDYDRRSPPPPHNPPSYERGGGRYDYDRPRSRSRDRGGDGRRDDYGYDRRGSRDDTDRRDYGRGDNGYPPVRGGDVDRGSGGGGGRYPPRDDRSPDPRSGGGGRDGGPRSYPADDRGAPSYHDRGASYNDRFGGRPPPRDRSPESPPRRSSPSPPRYRDSRRPPSPDRGYR